MSDEESTAEANKRPTFIRVLLSTLAAFIGVQSDKNRQRDFQQNSILPFMIVGIVLAASFIIGLFMVAKQIAH
jgi:uncharacterized membrane protein YidH (DUF202 family)